MATRIKICGFTRPKDIEIALKLGVNAFGFVFYPNSPRYVAPDIAKELLSVLPPFVSTVGLFVNSTPEQVQTVLNIAPVDLLQFHGDETPESCHLISSKVQRPFIRALRIKTDMTSDDLLEYARIYRQSSSRYKGLLLDTYVDEFGGSGKVFNWSIIPKELAPQVVLSGGLNAHNVIDAVNLVNPFAVDISSGVESAKGIKDAQKMRAFIEAVQLADTHILKYSHEK